MSQGALLLTAIYDGYGSSPKGVEVYVMETGAYEGYTLDIQSNANTTWMTGYTFDTTIYSAGQFLYVTSTPTAVELVSMSGVIIDDGSFTMNGDDRVRLTNGGETIDQYGVTDLDGTGEDWEYLDSYAVRSTGQAWTGNFELSEWSVAPVNSLSSSNSGLTSALGSYTIPEPAVHVMGLVGLGICCRRRRAELREGSA